LRSTAIKRGGEGSVSNFRLQKAWTVQKAIRSKARLQHAPNTKGTDHYRLYRGCQRGNARPVWEGGFAAIEKLNGKAVGRRGRCTRGSTEKIANVVLRGR